jgi:hypothetical protein
LVTAKFSFLTLSRLCGCAQAKPTTTRFDADPKKG